MEWNNFIELLLFFVITFACMIPLGSYMANVFTGKKTILHPLLGWLETTCYYITGIDPTEEMKCLDYAKALLYFNIFGFLTVFLIQLLQEILPLNPQNFPSVPWDTAFNTAISYVTNTNWQSYSGELTLSYFTQMVALTSQNFLSPATGMAVLLVLIRGLTGRMISTLGNFWVDLVRSIVYLFLPLSILLAFVLISQGVIQTFSPYIEISSLEGGAQIIPLGPVASQVAIKQLGTNGGGFFNANSAHPFENPTGLTNFLEMIAILLIPAASVYMYGLLINSKKTAIILLGVMCGLLIFGISIAVHSGHVYNPILDTHHYLEGQETRFGIDNTLFWTGLTTATSNGSVNSEFTSLAPLTGGIALFNIVIGEIIFGGVGVGLCGMVMFAMLTIFLSGLMVGRTPEKLGKKIERNEIQWIAMAVLFPTALALTGAGNACMMPKVIENVKNQGPHGLTEILYAFASCAGNNGSDFSDLNSNTLFLNLTLGVTMLLGRISILLPSLAIAGLFAKKNIIPPSIGSISTNSFLFAILLTSIILMIGALSFFPALALGPIIEYLLMREGRAF